MSDTYAPPSSNPASDGTMGGLLRQALGKHLQSTDDMLPARVIAYDRASNRATVQPMIMMGTTTGQRVSRAQVPAVPVFQYGGGGFVLSFPVTPGDLGWIKASDRDISLFLQSLNEEWPNTARMHSFSDAVFLPDIMRSWALDPADAAKVVLQSTDGATRIALGAGTIDLKAPVVTVNGNLVVTGTLAAAGGVTGAGGIVLETHRHTDVEPGGGTSGGPTP